jgi:hypothetical protein
MSAADGMLDHARCTPERVGKEFARALARRLCLHGNGGPCAGCVALTSRLARPVGRALFLAATGCQFTSGGPGWHGHVSSDAYDRVGRALALLTEGLDPAISQGGSTDGTFASCYSLADRGADVGGPRLGRADHFGRHGVPAAVRAQRTRA